MFYITKANSQRILKKIDINEISDLPGEVYKKPIYFLSKLEIKYLLLMKCLMEDPKKFTFEIYQPIVNVDKYQYVFESGQPPSYHSSPNCERLTSTFRNFPIPHEIKARVRETLKNQGRSEQEILSAEIKQVEDFRAWFKENFELLSDQPKEFLKKLDIRWNIKREISEIEKNNSGTESIDNYNLIELEKKIDNIISEAGKFFTNNKDKQAVLRKYQKLTFLAYKNGEIENNDTSLSDEELKLFLKMYDNNFKKPLKELLVQYYRVKFNPNLSFDGYLLEKLNFRKCSIC